jgi:hypothetical protein
LTVLLALLRYGVMIGVDLCCPFAMVYVLQGDLHGRFAAELDCCFVGMLWLSGDAEYSGVAPAGQRTTTGMTYYTGIGIWHKR